MPYYCIILRNLADVANIDLFGSATDSRTFVPRPGCSRSSALSADLAGSFQSRVEHREVGIPRGSSQSPKKTGIKRLNYANSNLNYHLDQKIV